MKIPPFEPAYRDESNVGISILLQPLEAELIGKMPSFLSLSVLRHLTFRQISRLPVVIGEWEYHHSTRLDEPVRMVVFPFFYDHWRPRYSMKRYQIGLFITFGTAPFDVSSNISASSGSRRMGIPPFEPARRGESNGGIPILLRPLDTEIFDETS